MGKKSESEKKKIKRKSVEDSPQKAKSKIKTESDKKEKKKNKNKNKKEKEIVDDSDEEEKAEEDEFEELIFPGQKYPTPPAGDATRAFYESLLEQNQNSLMAIKYCVEYGCLEQEKAKQLLEILDKEKNKKKKK